jgi:hypothetical protein
MSQKQHWLLRFQDRLPAVAVTVAASVILVGRLVLSIESLVTLVGLVLISLAGVLLSRARPSWSPRQFSEIMSTALGLAADRDIYSRYCVLADGLAMVGQRKDSIFRQLALEHLDEVVRRSEIIAEGQFTFEGTEAWRIAYERLLRSPGLHLYRSVAWIKHADYWQDEPGRKSMAINFELHDAGRLSIERIAIIADELWPDGEVWPAETLRQWLHEQYARGLAIKFVRESELGKESDLLVDMGIYGSRALGIQELDAASRTVRFTLSFEPSHVAKAEERWERLNIYAESFAGYLDRYEMP